MDLDDADGGDMDPESAAQFAQGSSDDVDAGGGGLMDSGGSPLERLLDGNAEGPSVGELRGDYQLDHWMALVVRGVLRAAPGRGMPPIGDITLGGLLGVRKFQTGQGGDDLPEFEGDLEGDV